MAGRLDGVLVVSVEQAVAGPYATSRLADAGEINLGGGGEEFV